MKARGAIRWGAALVAALALGELLARHYVSGPLAILRPSSDPALMYELVPGRYESDGYFTRTDVVEYVVDDRGCRVGAAGEHPNGPGVLILGGSLAFGIGVESDAALPAIVRDELRARRPPLDFAPQSCSVPGYTLEQTLHYAETAIRRGGARRIALLVGPKHGSVPYDWTRTVPRSTGMRWATGHSRLVRLGYLAYLIHETDGFRLPPAPPEHLRAALEAFAAAARASGARVIVFVIGALEHPAFDLPAELERRGLPMVLVRPPPHDPTNTTPDGDHYSREGARRIAEQMVPAMADLIGE